MTSAVASVLSRTSPAACLRQRRWRRPVFAIAARSFDWIDVFLAAMARGDWAPFERDLVTGLACLAEADSAGAGPSTARIAEAATAFRYQRDLLSGAETAAWLANHNVTLDAWTDYLARCLLLDRDRGALDAIVARQGETFAIPTDAFTAEGVCSGGFDRLAATLASRAAVAAQAAGPCPPVDQEAASRVATAHAAWLAALDPTESAARLGRLIAIDAAFAQVARAATTEAALAVELSRHRLEWTRIDLERLWFPTLHAAREAACLIREDAMTLTDAAIVSRQTVTDTRSLVEQLDPAWRHDVLAAGADELIGPIAVDSRYELGWLVAKSSPDLGDPIVRARAEHAVVSQLMSSASSDRVHWFVPRPRIAVP
jgi:hypothetical protein